MNNQPQHSQSNNNIGKKCWPSNNNSQKNNYYRQNSNTKKYNNQSYRKQKNNSSYHQNNNDSSKDNSNYSSFKQLQPVLQLILYKSSNFQITRQWIQNQLNYNILNQSYMFIYDTKEYFSIIIHFDKIKKKNKAMSYIASFLRRNSLKYNLNASPKLNLQKQTQKNSFIDFSTDLEKLIMLDKNEDNKIENFIDSNIIPIDRDLKLNESNSQTCQKMKNTLNHPNQNKKQSNFYQLGAFSFQSILQEQKSKTFKQQSQITNKINENIHIQDWNDLLKNQNCINENLSNYNKKKKKQMKLIKKYEVQYQVLPSKKSLPQKVIQVLSNIQLMNRLLQDELYRNSRENSVLYSLLPDQIQTSSQST